MEIKEARQLAGLTQAQLSERLCIPLRTIKSWETGERKPPEWCKQLIIEKIIKAE